MKCYLCSQEGEEEESLAICIVCGMGICKDHLVRDEISFWEAQFISSDMSPEGDRFSLPKKIPRIMCSECYEVMKRD
ncbi:MAG: DUF2180 family protein [Thermoplasmata archaeon]